MKKSKKTLACILSVAMMVTFIPTFSFAASSLGTPKAKVTSTSATSITISWSKVGSAKGYYVYCKAPGKTTYKKIETIKTGKTLTFVHKKLANGKKYSYKLKAYKGNTQSKYSKAVSGVTAAAETSMTQDVKKMVKSVNSKYSYNITNTLAYDSEYIDEEYGWRTAGSAAEHKASKYLAKEMKAIGLTNVERVPVDVDKWQFNGASLTLKNDGGDNKVNVKVDQIVSYASSFKGTVTEDIVYMGHGYESDYEAYYDKMGLKGSDRNMDGKIVLCDINQYTDYWITPHYTEAYNQGAGGIITYSNQYADVDEDTGEVTQTGTKWDSTCQMQDICSKDLGIPCMSISREDGLKLIDGINKIEAGSGKQQVNLYVDNEVLQNGGTSYNVVGMIKGTGNTGQQIVVAGHYDKYWWGFQDDSAAIGVVLGIAKTLVDSGYKPVNDIIFVAHGAEEWGRSGAEADWAMGSWEMITEAHPEWSGKTLALFNYELPTNKGTSDGLSVSVNSVEEIGSTTDEFNDSGLLSLLGSDISKDCVKVRHMSTPMSDEISYQLNGVPGVQVNTTFGKKSDVDGLFSTYHTKYDDKSTYDATAMYYNLAYSAAYLIQTDKLPAQQMDLSLRIDELEAGINADESIYNATDIAAYKAAITKLEAANAKYSAKIKSINDSYTKAMKAGADKATLAKIRAKGAAQNKKSLALYQYLQDQFIAFTNSTDVQLYHVCAQDSLNLLDKIISGFNGDGTISSMGAVLGNAWQTNGAVDYVAYNFGLETCAEAVKTISGGYTQDTWTYGRQPGLVNVNTATYNICNGITDEDGTYLNELNTYKSERDRIKTVLDNYVKSETAAMNYLANQMGQ